MNTPKPGDLYRHFKGNMYRVIGVATHTESEEQLVIYTPVEDPMGKIYARPLEMFLSPVDRVKYPDVKQELRFEPAGTMDGPAEA